MPCAPLVTVCPSPCHMTWCRLHPDFAPVKAPGLLQRTRVALRESLGKLGDELRVTRALQRRLRTGVDDLRVVRDAEHLTHLGEPVLRDGLATLPVADCPRRHVDEDR